MELQFTYANASIPTVWKAAYQSADGTWRFPRPPGGFDIIVREKPSFEPGYLRLKGVENAHAEWFFHAPIHADKYERVEVIPVVDESGNEV